MKYLIRTLRIFALLCVYLAALVGLMLLTGTSRLGAEDTLRMLLYTPQGWTLLAALAGGAALYPLIGFTSRQVAGDLKTDRRAIVEAFASGGFTRCTEQEQRLVFRAGSTLARLGLFFEDEIVVTQQQQGVIRYEGLRRGIARVEKPLRERLAHRTRYE